MKKIVLLLFIYIASIQANEEEANLTNNKIMIQPTISEKKPYTQKVEPILRKLLKDLRDYKKRNKLKTEKLIEELSKIKKELQLCQIKRDKEIKELKAALYSSNTKLKITKNKLIEKEKKRPLMIQPLEKEAPTKDFTVHKIIRKMQPLPIVMYDTPWIEIVVQNNIDIYELALKYYGDEQEYKKIYLANKNTIDDSLKIYNGMTLVIPITNLFQEQGLLLNQ